MGQKVNPNGLRVGVIDDWSSHWYADKNTFSDCLVEDQKIREFVLKAVEPIARGNAKKPVDESRTNVAGVSRSSSTVRVQTESTLLLRQLVLHS